MTTTVTSNKVEASSRKKEKTPVAPAAGAVANLGPAFDPFDQGHPFKPSNGPATPDLDVGVGKSDKVHIRLQQRNGRKTLTTVQGLPDKYDYRKLLKVMKKEFACNGTIVREEDADLDENTPAVKKGAGLGDVLQFQGDHRIQIRDFLIAKGFYTEAEAKDSVIVHGY
ncbi:translation initiation factor SUI1 [Tremella mesenterica]|uniref:Translation initiation factor SUI1 n=1 Tax=Tremella mesenterica TaxID=5217 RepID=A0A4Q1BH09_TREME|nr:uncharacterized protein TREMEDRAFT_74789 [Tremella mesenterica DSM 1558]EIW66310.1 hypothetical protein TREMEDRAFT_74789 [Tremella mesenterica DSM 1558]RXK36876.1 translation initiation factor SUI1 [Tremella mesenterica]